MSCRIILLQTLYKYNTSSLFYFRTDTSMYLYCIYLPVYNNYTLMSNINEKTAKTIGSAGNTSSMQRSYSSGGLVFCFIS